MAEEESKSLGVPGNIFPSGKPSFSDKECDNDAYSIGKPSSPMTKQKITPHHRMVSTGSCHDLCKNGLKHDLEEKEKRHWLMKKVMLTSSGKNNCVRTVAPTELKKSSLARSKSCPINISNLSQHETSDAISSPRPHNAQSGHNTHKAEKKLNRSSQKFSPPLHSLKARPQPAKSRPSCSLQTAAISKEALNSSKIISKIPRSIQTSGGANGIKKRRDDEKISDANAKLSPPSLTERTSMERGQKRDDVLTRKNRASFSSSSIKRLASHGSSLSSRPCIGRKTAMEPGIVASVKLVSSLKDQNRRIKKEIRKTTDEHVPEKTLHVVEIETKPKLSESTEVKDIIPPFPPQSNLSPVLPSLQVLSLSSYEEVGGVEKEVVVYENGIHREDEIKLGAEEKEEEEEEEEEEEHTDEDEVELKEEKEDEVEQEEEKEDEEEEDEDEEEEEEEQQQHLEEEEEMETETEEGDDNDDDDDYEEEENVHESDEEDKSIIGNKTINCDDLNAVEGNMRKPLRKRDAISDSGDSVQVFRSGKVLDIHSENKTPRRLRFRKARIVEENHGSKNQTSKRNFNRRQTSKANSNNTSDQKIVLRHKDLEEKKDAQGLSLNNVIGETANKLVASRKSKVKALVGAFETVISLHDRKLSAQLAA